MTNYSLFNKFSKKNHTSFISLLLCLTIYLPSSFAVTGQDWIAPSTSTLDMWSFLSPEPLFGTPDEARVGLSLFVVCDRIFISPKFN